MSELEFMRGFMAGSGLSEPTRAGRAYAQWLEREVYALVERIELEAGGYESGFEVGTRWRETNQPVTFICPDCGAVSYNPSDVKHRYCGSCHEFKN